MKQQQWTIGLVGGATPLSLEPAPNNPIITAEMVTDVAAEFVADPFLTRANGQWYLFFETQPSAVTSGSPPPPGVIGVAQSTDLTAWKYLGTVLAEPWHLSYPYVFELNDIHYMIPETLGANCVRLYESQAFPFNWQPVADLVAGQHADPSLFYVDQTWWLFTCPKPAEHNELALYFASDLVGPWKPHPMNPLLSDDAHNARPAGRVLTWQGRLFRFAQDCWPRYGTQVRMFEILEITTDNYREQEVPQSPILTPSGNGWNGRNMHHIDLHCVDANHWIACVDGYFADDNLDA
ncbi:hypothetical protein GCM10008090_12210 [Arenicella chitinivorans]|uniref:Glucosamine inositolphosphorylceramide transferase 1 N-terminal domain-containing protein n=1 Tax=Arenicella chitinivorans TaxID=1329800 RepID=A0A918VJN0_9GAMM|nr:hypothetical protein [Arenicella chitinivorans]GHA04407.1 hypothetical protein GCM10008090_12210 [Arenicella chitinivorans]